MDFFERLGRVSWGALGRLGWVALVVAASASCSGGSGAELLVDLQTDLRPGFDFVAVQTTVRGQDDDAVLASASEPATSASSFLPDPSRVAEFEALEHGDVAVHLALVDAAGETVVERTVHARISGSRLLQITITSSCVDLGCPGPADSAEATECLAGRCVPPSCETFDDTSCGEPECSADADCAATAGCARGACSEGACLSVADDASCGEEEYCDVELGCSPVEPDVDPDPPSCTPPLGETFTILRGDDSGSGVTARPREAVAAFHGEHVWVVVTTTASLVDTSVLVRIDCEGAREDPRVILSDSVDPHLALDGDRVAVASPGNDGGGNHIVFLDRASGDPLGGPVDIAITDWMSGIAKRPDGGFDLMFQVTSMDSERAAALQTVDAAGAPVGELRVLHPEPTVTQTRAVVTEGPGGSAAAFQRVESASSWSDGGVVVWTEDAGAVILPSTADRQMQLHPPSLVRRGDLVWAAVGPAGDGGLIGGETIDGRFVRLYSVSSSGTATFHELPSPPDGAGDYLADLVPLGDESLALLWVRRYADGRGNEIYARRLDLAGGVTAGPEVAIPTSMAVDWDESVFTGADIGGGALFVTWREDLSIRDPAAFYGRFVSL